VTKNLLQKSIELLISKFCPALVNSYYNPLILGANFAMSRVDFIISLYLHPRTCW